MAIHTKLPIYKLAYDLLDMAVDVTRNIPRDFKRLIGEKVREECVELATVILNRGSAVAHNLNKVGGK